MKKYLFGALSIKKNGGSRIRSMKKSIGKIGLALAIVFVVSGVVLATKAYGENAEAQASKDELYKKMEQCIEELKNSEIIDSYTVEVGENSYVEYEETDSVRSAVYYEDGAAVQRSVYNLETGEIIYHDLRQGTTTEYHIDDFKKSKENE